MPELPETLNCDANGNLASRVGATSGTTTYTWSAKNQLTQINGPGLTAAFEYDALGRRIARTVNGNTTGFLYDGAQAIAELKANALDTRYHTGTQIDEVLARYAPAGNKTLLTDALNSVIAQASDTQAIENYYAYSPYGEAQTLGPDGGNPLQYTGRENDGTGLMYYRARYYDPVLKRFVSEDPIGTFAGFNFYGYVDGDPVNSNDPTGEITRKQRSILRLVAELYRSIFSPINDPALPDPQQQEQREERQVQRERANDNRSTKPEEDKKNESSAGKGKPPNGGNGKPRGFPQYPGGGGRQRMMLPAPPIGIFSPSPNFLICPF